MGIYNIYCDESCHLENDNQKVMVLGCVWCPVDKRKEIAIRLREIKLKNNLGENFELKWTKVSPEKQAAYTEILDYFFDDDDLHFRGLIVPDKKLLQHEELLQNHDTWYYKMYFDMLKTIFDPSQRYNIYLDIKDTLGGKKVKKLHDALCNNFYDFSKKIISKIQLVHSAEVEQIQLADFLTGIIMYANRGQFCSTAKKTLVERMQARSHYSLTRTTLLRENKINLFRWQAKNLQQ